MEKNSIEIGEDKVKSKEIIIKETMQNYKNANQFLVHYDKTH